MLFMLFLPPPPNVVVLLVEPQADGEGVHERDGPIIRGRRSVKVRPDLRAEGKARVDTMHSHNSIDQSYFTYGIQKEVPHVFSLGPQEVFSHESPNFVAAAPSSRVLLQTTQGRCIGWGTNVIMSCHVRMLLFSVVRSFHQKAFHILTCCVLHHLITDCGHITRPVGESLSTEQLRGALEALQTARQVGPGPSLPTAVVGGQDPGDLQVERARSVPLSGGVVGGVQANLEENCATLVCGFSIFS